MEVQGEGSTSTGFYRLFVEGDFANDDPGGVDCATATVARDTSNLPIPGIRGDLSILNDRDFFQVQIRQNGGQLTVFTTGETNTRGRLYNTDCDPVNDMNYDSSGGGLFNFHFSVEQLPAGVYYVEVQGEGSTTIGSYRLFIEGADFPPGRCNGEDATITGTDEDDVIPGTPMDDIIVALDGNDVVYGHGGNDIICGGEGNDVLFGGNGHDRLFGQVGDDVLIGEAGRDRLHGGTENDICDGGDGRNTESDESCELDANIP